MYIKSEESFQKSSLPAIKSPRLKAKIPNVQSHSLFLHTGLLPIHNMCCNKNRAPRCSSCYKRAPCHRRNCAAKNAGTIAIPQQAHAANPIAFPVEGKGFRTTESDTPPEYQDVVPTQQHQNGGLVGFLMKKYQGAQRNGDAETVKALDSAFEAGRMAGLG